MSCYFWKMKWIAMLLVCTSSNVNLYQKENQYAVCSLFIHVSFGLSKRLDVVTEQQQKMKTINRFVEFTVLHTQRLRLRKNECTPNELN